MGRTVWVLVFNFMYWTCNSMNNLSSYCGLVDAKIGASDKDLPVPRCPCLTNFGPIFIHTIVSLCKLCTLSRSPTIIIFEWMALPYNLRLKYFWNLSIFLSDLTKFSNFLIWELTWYLTQKGSISKNFDEYKFDFRMFLTQFCSKNSEGKKPKNS